MREVWVYEFCVLVLLRSLRLLALAVLGINQSLLACHTAAIIASHTSDLSFKGSQLPTALTSLGLLSVFLKTKEVFPESF